MPARHAMPLNTPQNVLRELTRLYRMGLNGKIQPDEMTKFAFVLREIRAGLEAIAPPTLDHVEGLVVDTVIINGVPSGTFLSKEEIDRLNSQFVETPPPHISSLPMLRVIEHESKSKSDPPPPAA